MQRFDFGSKLTALQAANDACANPVLPWQQEAGNDMPWQITDEDGDDDSLPDSPTESP
jgi:hypothetical protein